MTISVYPYHKDKHFARNQDYSLYDVSKFYGFTNKKVVQLDGFRVDKSIQLSLNQIQVKEKPST